jgi:hypothetical protein
MWRWKRRTRYESSNIRSAEHATAESPVTLTTQQKRIISLGESGRYRTALQEILRGLRQNPDDSFLLKVAVPIAGASRTANLAAAEPATHTQQTSALLAPVATVCSSCGAMWYSKHLPSWSADRITAFPPAGLQCRTCRYTLCRGCLSITPLSADDPIVKFRFIRGECPGSGHGLLEMPVLPTGRGDVVSIRPDRIEAVIVTRSGPIPPTIDELLDVVPRFVPITVDDVSLIHIRPGGSGLMAERSRQEELARTHVRDLERGGVVLPGAWNRAECVVTEARNAAAHGNYLLVVVGKADPVPEKAMGPASSSITVDDVLAAAAGLPVARDDDVQYDFDFAGPKWGAREILVLTSDELRCRLAAVCAADAANGFTTMTMSMSSKESWDKALPYVQLDTLSDTLRTFRPYRITKRNDGRFAVYGHATLYGA